VQESMEERLAKEESVCAQAIERTQESEVECDRKTGNIRDTMRDTGRAHRVALALQCAAVFFSVLQCVAVCCSVMRCVAVCCSALQYIACFAMKSAKGAIGRSYRCGTHTCNMCMSFSCMDNTGDTCERCVNTSCDKRARQGDRGGGQRYRHTRNVLQCVAVRCSALQCVAVRCSVLQCVAVCCSVLHYAAVCGRVLQCIAMCCSALQCIAVCSVLQCLANRQEIEAKVKGFYSLALYCCVLHRVAVCYSVWKMCSRALRDRGKGQRH